jgi:SAM-dependent methyltransferase
VGKKSKLRREQKLEQEKQRIVGRINEHRRFYARTWEKAQAHKFEQDAHYEWMASFLEGYQTVLEIGTGTGEGTRALLERGHTVISIDENPECIKLAHNRIASTGREVVYEARERLIVAENGYTIQYSVPQSSPVVKGALLLDGDIINDPELLTWLEKLSPIDAVVCWLIGTHEARPANTLFLRRRVNNPGEYRLCVQNRVYEVADKVLRPEGVVHIVDRGEQLTKSLEEDVLNAHRDQASVTSLNVESIDYRLYQEPDAEKKIPMGETLGVSGRVPQDYNPAIISIIARKPPAQG